MEPGVDPVDKRYDGNTHLVGNGQAKVGVMSDHEVGMVTFQEFAVRRLFVPVQHFDWDPLATATFRRVAPPIHADDEKAESLPREGTHHGEDYLLDSAFVQSRHFDKDIDLFSVLASRGSKVNGAPRQERYRRLPC